jgi:multidrug efflux pump subunit AcrB
VRRVRGTARTGWPGAGSEDSGDAVGIWSLLSLSRAFRVMGPDPAQLREIARSVEEIMRNDPNMRTVNVDWGERVPKLHFVLNQERLQLIGLSPEAAAQQLQFLLNGQTITQVREDIRAVNIVARSAGPERLDPTKLENFTLTTPNGKPIPLSQIGRVEIQSEDPLIKRRDRVPTVTVRGDNIETTQQCWHLFHKDGRYSTQFRRSSQDLPIRWPLP